MDKRTIGVLFGGVSPEHEVSVISAHQVIAAMDRERFDPVPVYVGKDGRWYTGAVLADLDAFKDVPGLLSQAHPVSIAPSEYGRLRLDPPAKSGLFRGRIESTLLDAVFLAFHGGAGEDGGIQGLCEALNVPYTGSGVPASSMGMDKVLSKVVCEHAGVPVVKYLPLYEWLWAGSEEKWLDQIDSEIGYPVIVKPARLGSSIGIAVASDRKRLDAAIEEAFRFDNKVVVERSITNLMEINCAVLGTAASARVSALEQPIRSDESAPLTFTDKYQRGGTGTAAKTRGGGKLDSDRAAGMASLDRIIPAPVSDERAAEITSLALKVFTLFECAGVARIDFLIDRNSDQVFFNEINTLPGSFSFYLWEPVGLDFTSLVSEMIDIAMKRNTEANSRVRSYDVNLLSEESLSGLKGAKHGGRSS